MTKEEIRKLREMYEQYAVKNVVKINGLKYNNHKREEK